MSVAKTPFFHQKKDGSVEFVNAGEEIPAGVDAGDNVRGEPKQEPQRRTARKAAEK